MNNDTDNDDFDFDDDDGVFFVPSEYCYDVRRILELKQKYGLSRMEGLEVLEKCATPEELKGLRWQNPDYEQFRKNVDRLNK